MAEEKKRSAAELEANKRASILSFEEASIASDLMSEREILRHREMQSLAMKWLFQQGYVAASEIILPNQRRADVIGYKNDEIIIIEVKASRADYQRDTKWREYLPYCDTFYFLLDFSVPDAETKQTGFLQLNGTRITIQQEDGLLHHAKQSDEIHWLISRALSQKMIFGFY